MSALKRASRQIKSATELQADADGWNTMFGVGKLVKYYPTLGVPNFETVKTSGQAFVLSGHTVVVQLEGKAGCFALSHCIPC